MILRGLASGYRICVSPAENLGYLLGVYERHLQKIISDYVSTGSTVYDIGANVGYVSLCLAKRVGSSGHVVAFEPVPRNIDCFKETIRINRLANVQLWECAASDVAGETEIRIAENSSTASIVWHRNNPTATRLTVKVVCVDDLVEAGDVGYPTFVKIDAEGAEGSVLMGMRRTIAAAKPVVFVECSEAGREAAWSLLRDLGYRCQSAITGKSIHDFEDYTHSDFLWLPASGTSSQ